MASAESTRDGKRFSKLPEMPVAVRSHCQVTVDANTVLVLGRTTPKNPWDTITLQLDLVQRKWMHLPRMNTGRTHFACGAVKAGKKVIIAGGHLPHYTDKVEILDMSTLTWSSGTTYNKVNAGFCLRRSNA